jgi:exopolysaccharide biosynthesis polyprenyl glycosylphosphotransferase
MSVDTAAPGPALPDFETVLDRRTKQILERRRRTATVRRRGWLVFRMLLVADILGLTIAFASAELFIAAHSAHNHSLSLREIFAFALSLPGWVLVAKLYKLYDRDERLTGHVTADEAASVLHLVIVCTWMFFAVTWVTGIAHPQVSKLLVFTILSVLFVSVGRAAARAIARRRLTYLQNTVIVGAGSVGHAVAQKLQRHPEYGVNLLGFVDANPLESCSGTVDTPVLGPPSMLPTLVRLFDVERIVIAFSQESQQETVDLIRSLKDFDVYIDVVPRCFEVVAPGMAIHALEGVPVVAIPPLRLATSSRLVKRLMDIVLSLTALVVLAPLFGLIAVAIKLDSPGPVLFRQRRRGSEDTTFEILKFRTMVQDAEAQKHTLAHLNMHATNGGDSRMFKIPHDPRITPIGALLRRYSLDELPQVFNVLRGEMSLVGPRPLILEEDQFVGTWARKRLMLKPGITGLWQILGRSTIPFEEMTRLDWLYVTNWSVGSDLRILLRTLPMLLGSRGAY